MYKTFLKGTKCIIHGHFLWRVHRPVEVTDGSTGNRSLVLLVHYKPWWKTCPPPLRPPSRFRSVVGILTLNALQYVGHFQISKDHTPQMPTALPVRNTGKQAFQGVLWNKHCCRIQTSITVPLTVWPRPSYLNFSELCLLIRTMNTIIPIS